MEMVELDQAVLDVLVVDRCGIPLGRPTVAAARCKGTGAIVGIGSSLDGTGAAAIRECLRDTLAPKDVVLQTSTRIPPLVHDWPASGRPETLVVPNLPVFHDVPFWEACGRLGIELRHEPPRHGGLRRFFRMLERDVRYQLVGLPPAPTTSRLGRDEGKFVCVSEDELRHVVTSFAVDVYNQMFNRALGEAPARLWEEGVRRFPVRSLRDNAELEFLFAGTEVRTLSRRGIQLFGLQYPATEDARRILRRCGQRLRVTVRYDLCDLGRVRVQDPYSGGYVPLTCSAPEYATGLSAEQHLRRVALDRLCRSAAFRDTARARPSPEVLECLGLASR